jgi:Response regulator containing a CheY-like receiver domain and an HTH DNA-binding domain
MQNATSKSTTGKFIPFVKNENPVNNGATDNLDEVDELISFLYRESMGFLLLLNLEMNKYQYVSPSFRRVIGHSPEILMEKGPDFLHSLYDPEENDFHNFILNEINVFYNSLPPYDKLNYLYKYLIRLCRKDGRYVNLLCQQQYLQTDTQKRPLLAAQTFMDITHFITGNHKNLIVEKFDQDNGFSETVYNFMDNEKENKLSKREREIYRLVKEGCTSKEIAEKLNISKKR